jgi:formate dehydrogenase major subunit
MKLMLGTGAATNTFDDIERAAPILVAGCNPLENHPVVGARIRQAVRRGARLIVIDPRRTGLAEIADVHLAVRPGANIPLLNALAATIVGEGLVDPTFLASRVDGFDDYAASLDGFAPEDVAERCGVAARDIRAAARLYATATPAMCFHGLGITEHLQGTEGVCTLINLALLAGNVGRRGGGVNPLRGQNNVQGSAHMGCEPSKLACMVDIDENRDRFEAVWGAEIPKRPGLNLMKMIDKASEGGFKAMWTIGYDVYLSNANMDSSDAGFGNMELVIIQDLFLNETAKKYGTVFLPACTSFEKDGTFMNSERRVNRVRKAIESS